MKVKLFACCAAAGGSAAAAAAAAGKVSIPAQTANHVQSIAFRRIPAKLFQSYLKAHAIPSPNSPDYV